MLQDRVRVARRFLRSIRIDQDLGQAEALEGFICPPSSAEVLETMGRHVSETGQGAFTWTGPYGSGKSSLVVALSALLGGGTRLRSQAEEIFGRELTETIWNSLPVKTKGWRFLPIVGRRQNPVIAIGEALQAAGLAKSQEWSEESLVRTICGVAAKNPRSRGGLVVFIDEMGKFLEGAAREGTDIYVFQQLAEAASRSGGRLLIVGILHQAFEEYAHHLSRDMRDEWSKIQGRFIDLPISTVGEEQIDLISHAIECDRTFRGPSTLSRLVAAIIHKQRSGDSEKLASKLENCWPLHPVVACLLGPISRRRFGQNQRTIFGFLNSAEPHGFQDFLRHSEDDTVYEPVQLWDYLRANLEPSILASPDGHRWALAVEALERCESKGGDALHLELLRTIAIVDLFKERSGLLPSFALLRACFPQTPQIELKKALRWLDQSSFTLFKKFLDAYAIYAGSDFDIDQAVSSELAEVGALDFSALKALAGFHPILAKRHYHENGILRWFDINLSSLNDASELVTNYAPNEGTIGQFLLAFATEGESEENAERVCGEAAEHAGDWDLLVGVSRRSRMITSLAEELIALEAVRNNRPELAGDAVARREVEGRLAVLQGQLESELHAAFDTALWFQKSSRPARLGSAQISGLASDLADRKFGKCPQIHNELLNRQKPSSSAVAAQNALLRRMVSNQGEVRLGIQGFPAEGGLFTSILDATGLYASDGEVFSFASPKGEDACRLIPMWDAAERLVRERAFKRPIPVGEIYDLWRRPPFGVKDGLMPVLAVAFILSHRNEVAVYREGVFRVRFDDVDVEYLARDSACVQLRWMDLTDAARQLLSEMALIVRTLDQKNALMHLEPIDVARGLVAIYEDLPPWSKRTMQLSANAIRIRDLLKRASDPNQFLFDDVPAAIGDGEDIETDEGIQQVVEGVRGGLTELVRAYPSMTCRLKDLMLSELQVPNLSLASLEEVRERAANIKQLAGDFHLEAFIGRLSQFDVTDESFEGIASLAARKPPRDWVDPDYDRAAIEIADLAQRFLRAETYARVKGRSEKRHAIAVVLGTGGRPVPLLEEFEISDADLAEARRLTRCLADTLNEAGASNRNVVLSALAEVTATYVEGSPSVSREREIERVDT